MLDSAPEIDGLLNRFFQMLGNPFMDIITVLIEVCWKLKYYLRKFKAARTVVLRKSNKRDYKSGLATIPKASIRVSIPLVLFRYS